MSLLKRLALRRNHSEMPEALDASSGLTVPLLSEATGEPAWTEGDGTLRPAAHTHVDAATGGTVAHSALTGIGASDHHTKYTDAEAVAATAGSYEAAGAIATHTAVAGAHHTRYSDAEAVAATAASYEAIGAVAAHTGDATDAHDASAISVLDAAATYAATDVEAALAEVMGEVVGHLVDAAAAHAASAISIEDSAGNVTATDVEAAIAEIYTDMGALGAGTPASTVASETTYGITPAVGTDTEYARQDHTHGSPADPGVAAAISSHAGDPDAHHVLTAPLVTAITSGSGTHTLTGSPRWVVIEATGGGGGGGSCSIRAAGQQAAAGGGGGGGHVRFHLNAPPASFTYAVGAAGTAGTAGGAGGNGGDTTCDGTGINIDAYGGLGGQAHTSTASNVRSEGGPGGSATGGQLNASGQGGGTAAVVTDQRIPTGAGGNAGSGSGGARAVNDGTGASAAGVGGGGGGASSAPSTAARDGGAGASGGIIVIEYY